MEGVERITLDEDSENLFVAGEKFEMGDDGSFEVRASCIRTALLSDLPVGCSITLCDRVVGSGELFRRSPNCNLERSERDGFIAHGETAFVVDPDDDIDQDVCAEFFAQSIKSGRNALATLVADGTIFRIEERVYEEIAYLMYSLKIPDQPILEAETFMAAIDERVREGIERPLMFICHASEDSAFVERLVVALDRRALHAWFDKREILVGDSIVHRINEALAETRYLLPVLSSRSVVKPWVRRELNSSLMRQLAGQRITILPVLVDQCDLPPLLADIKYADFRASFDQGFADLLRAIQRSKLARCFE
jgi:hypothetical protein